METELGILIAQGDGRNKELYYLNSEIDFYMVSGFYVLRDCWRLLMCPALMNCYHWVLEDNFDSFSEKKKQKTHTHKNVNSLWRRRRFQKMAARICRSQSPDE